MAPRLLRLRGGLHHGGGACGAADGRACDRLAAGRGAPADLGGIAAAERRADAGGVLEGSHRDAVVVGPGLRVAPAQRGGARDALLHDVLPVRGRGRPRRRRHLGGRRHGHLRRRDLARPARLGTTSVERCARCDRVVAACLALGGCVQVLHVLGLRRRPGFSVDVPRLRLLPGRCRRVPGRGRGALAPSHLGHVGGIGHIGGEGGWALLR
mmetsp:Transcript_62101/g.178679  ORF Transcript_62101/g.178679 Transcript_62101/m.178679 type:complete len:211 (-) Transcript_62101:506-1138(-)